MVNATKETSSKEKWSVGFIGGTVRGRSNTAMNRRIQKGEKKAVITDRYFIKFDCKGNGIRMIIGGSIRLTKALSTFFFPR